jgi:hypothetical protein
LRNGCTPAKKRPAAVALTLQDVFENASKLRPYPEITTALGEVEPTVSRIPLSSASFNSDGVITRGSSSVSQYEELMLGIYSTKGVTAIGRIFLNCEISKLTPTGFFDNQCAFSSTSFRALSTT